MAKQKDNNLYLKLAQLLGTADIQSTLSEKYAEIILHKEGDINFQISDNTILGSTKPELLGCTALHLALKENKLKLFNLLLKHGADFNIRNSRGYTVLHQIIEDMYEKKAESSDLKTISDNPFATSVLDTIVISGNSHNSSNEKGITHFHIACMANHVSAVELILKREVFKNQSVIKDSPIFPGYTAFHFAARFSNLDVVKILLKYGVKSNIKDAKGMTPLYLLIKQNIEIAELLNKNEVLNAKHLTTQRKNNEEIMDLLLNQRTNLLYDTGLTYLHIACVMESIQKTSALLCNTEYINHAVNSSSSLFSGNTALHFAALCNVEWVKFLLQNGANIHLRNAKGQTAFDLCIERYELQDICDIISSQPDWIKIEISRKRTVLDFVSSLQTCELPFLDTNRSKMIDGQINRKSPVWPTYSLLHVAVILSERNCKNDSMMIERVVQKLGTTVTFIAKLGTSPLHLAFRLKKAKVVNYLLTANCQRNMNFIDTSKLSHLHIACAAGITSVVDKLLLNGANIHLSVEARFDWYRHPQLITSLSNVSWDVFIPKRSTPLHIAVIVGHCETMKLLMDNGANPYAEDEYGMTPIHWLIMSDNPILPAADILFASILKERKTNTGLSHFHVACFANNVLAVEHLLNNDSPNINAISYGAVDHIIKFPGLVRYTGYSPLHFALEGKSQEVISLLLRHGANVLMSNPIKNSIPLYEALADEKSLCASVFRSLFESSKALQEQLEKNLGLTMLHFYCCTLDDKAAENLLNNGAANVNKSILLNSPIWPGCTPLHVLMNFYQVSNPNANNLLCLLLNHGADVTSLNAQQNSPLHLAYNLDVETTLQVSLLTTLLRHQKSFNVNPRNTEGLSHFHIACALGAATLNNFLWENVDVNERIDYFYENRKGNKSISGCTALHLVLFGQLNQQIKPSARLKRVTQLIKHGANVRTENSLGNTPLHLAVTHYPNKIRLLTKLVDAGSDIYAINILGQTPLELMLNSENVTVNGIKFFLERGYHINAFNPITQKGFVAIIFSTQLYFQQQNPILHLMKEACCNVQLNGMKRNFFHNIVSTSTPDISSKLYLKIIEPLVKTMNIDQQDDMGRTPLHIATQFKNHRAVYALLQAGADMNIIDTSKKTAFVYAFETSWFFDESQDNSEKIVNIFSKYVQQLIVCVLDVDKLNENALFEAFINYNVDFGATQCFYQELEEMRKVNIGSSSINLLNFVSGTNSESVNLGISQLKRNVIDNLYENIDKTRFHESLGIIRLQCRKFSRKSVAE